MLVSLVTNKFRFSRKPAGWIYINVAIWTQVQVQPKQAQFVPHYVSYIGKFILTPEVYSKWFADACMVHSVRIQSIFVTSDNCLYQVCLFLILFSIYSQISILFFPLFLIRNCLLCDCAKFFQERVGLHRCLWCQVWKTRQVYCFLVTCAHFFFGQHVFGQQVFVVS